MDTQEEEEERVGGFVGGRVRVDKSMTASPLRLPCVPPASQLTAVAAGGQWDLLTSAHNDSRPTGDQLNCSQTALELLKVYAITKEKNDIGF